MRKLDTQKHQPSQDWHRADIVAAIWKRGSSLIRLSRQHGYASNSLCYALRTPWPAAEKIIADFIGVPPQTIWPSRYNWNGTGKRRPRGHYGHSRNLNTGSQRSVIQRKRTA
jgi:Ner family transcriptional regulator